MKKVYFFLMFFGFQLAFSQQITNVEYWFGDDFANRVPHASTTNGADETDFNIPFPDINGNEIDAIINYRFRDNHGNWSVVYSQNMNNNMDTNSYFVQVEYWFDDDFTNKTIVSLTQFMGNNGLDYQQANILWHENAQKIHYRFKSNYNQWSSIQTSDKDNSENVNNQVIAVEYWFNDDFDSKQLVSVSENANNETDLSLEFLDDGIHQIDDTVHYRFLDNLGNWTSIYSQKMPNNNDVNAFLVEVQYWFDDAFNDKQIILLQNSFLNSNLDNQKASLPWQENAQIIHYRFKSKYNQWSSIQSSNIDNIENRDNKIIAIEYWINDDLASKETIDVTQNDSIYFDERDINMIINSCNSEIIHLRYKDKMNRYSCIYTFYQDNQNSKSGITVLVHGFQATGGGISGELSPTEDFEKIGNDILVRAGGGALYKNNTSTGQIELINGTYTFDPTKEIVLVYDWGDLSNNGVTNTNYAGNGYLEAASDNLLATFLKLKELPFYSTFTNEVFLSKPKHFIAHSRGTILTLQFLHRLMTYFPNVAVDQFTLLDPHPATTFGDLHTDQINSPLNLPGVEGVATNCGNLTIGCLTAGDDVVLKIPKNVLRADNYFRTDQQGYEGVGYIGAFDGIAVDGLSCYNRKLNNSILIEGSPTFLNIPFPLGIPNPHSGVHKWYRGTINLSLNVAQATLSDSSTNTNNWYTNGSLNMTNNFLSNETRSTTGFNHSRIGGGTPVALLNDLDKIDLTQMNIKLRDRYGLSEIEYPNGVAPHTVFGGYFDLNNEAGWYKNGGETTGVIIDDGKAVISNNFNPLPTHSVLKHSLMYFGELYNFLRINVYEATSTSTVAYPSIKVTFFDNQNNQIGLPYIKVLSPSHIEQYIPLPINIKGEVGTFQIEYDTNILGSFKVDEIKLIEEIPLENSTIINLKLNIQGYYDLSTHDMRAVKMNQGIGSDLTVVDDITVELVNATSLQTSAVAFAQLKTNGTVTCNFPTLVSGSYYIVIKHRNAVQTWSSSTITIGASLLIYDFSDAQTKAYGSNLVELEPGVYGLFSGDINQDEVIDGNDPPDLEKDIFNSESGYLATDINGDGSVDNADLPFITNNIFDSVFSVHP